jgi:hypothetical protein
MTTKSSSLPPKFIVTVICYSPTDELYCWKKVVKQPNNSFKWLDDSICQLFIAVILHLTTARRHAYSTSSSTPLFNWRFCHMQLTCTRGDQKISGIVTKIYWKYPYKFETLVTFKVLPLWLDAAIAAMLPLQETLSKTFNRNAVKGRQWFSLNLCNVSTTPPFQNLLHPWVKKSRKERSRVSRGGGTPQPFCF